MEDTQKQTTDQAGIIITLIFHVTFIFINEIYGPYALLFVVNQYLTDICRNNIIIANNSGEISSINEDLSKLDRNRFVRSLSSLLLQVENLPEASLVDPSLEKLTKPGEWKFYGLYLMGRAVEKNVRDRLEISGTLRGTKDIWNAFVTILKPGSEIGKHKSITKGLLRYMMPILGDGVILEVFEGKDRNDMDDEFGEKVKGKKKVASSQRMLLDHEIIFDAMEYHSIHNQGKSWCMILVIDIIRPLQGFAFGVNRMALGIASKHPLIDRALKMSES